MRGLLELIQFLNLNLTFWFKWRLFWVLSNDTIYYYSDYLCDLHCLHDSYRYTSLFSESCRLPIYSLFCLCYFRDSMYLFQLFIHNKSRLIFKKYLLFENYYFFHVLSTLWQVLQKTCVYIWELSCKTVPNFDKFKNIYRIIISSILLILY